MTSGPLGLLGGNDASGLGSVGRECCSETKARLMLRSGESLLIARSSTLSARAASSRGLSAAAETGCQDPGAPLMHPGRPPEPSSPQILLARKRLFAALSSSGASRDRTGDLLLAKQALSQLSYGPSVG
jgi:hypothetical protein